MNDPENCPHCNISLLGEPIPDNIKQHYNSATHWKREIGIEVRGLYDGVYYYKCPDCDGEWGGYREIKEDLCPIIRQAKNLLDKAPAMDYSVPNKEAYMLSVFDLNPGDRVYNVFKDIYGRVESVEETAPEVVEATIFWDNEIVPEVLSYLPNIKKVSE